MILGIMEHRRAYGLKSFYVSLTSLCLSFKIIVGSAMGTLKARLAQYDKAHELLRQCTIPEEDRAKSAQWSCEYRWFKAPNVVCPGESSPAEVIGEG